MGVKITLHNAAAFGFQSAIAVGLSVVVASVVVSMAFLRLGCRAVYASMNGLPPGCDELRVHATGRAKCGMTCSAVLHCAHARPLPAGPRRRLPEPRLLRRLPEGSVRGPTALATGD